MIGTSVWVVRIGLALAITASLAIARVADPSRMLQARHEPITPIPPPPAADPAKIALGESLFKDQRLSHDGTLACVSCHDVSTNGANSRQPRGSTDGFDTPSVFNASLSFRLDWEGDYRSLESQAQSALTSPKKMASSVDEALHKLSADQNLIDRFQAAYGRPPDGPALFDAIATYERSLVTPDSRFDNWLNGDSEALSEQEQAGYALFKSLGCISCHQGVNIGGNLLQRHGIFRPLASPKPELVRVPSLRNVATTAPYFHDGSAPTLQDAIRMMAAAQLDQTLSDEQVSTIAAFLDTLTGNYRNVPVRAGTQ